jgi:uncharacterized protein (DUF305 family)
MNRDTIVLAVAAAAATLGLSACGGGSMPGMDHGSGSQPAITASASFNTADVASFNTADVQFAQMMIPHHAQAVEMAALAATRAADPDLKTLAATMKSGN